MTQYALIFNSQLTPSYIADQLMYIDEGFNYVEGEPCVKVDVSELEIYAKQGLVFLDGQKIAEFPSRNFRSAECFIVPVSFIQAQYLNKGNENVQVFPLSYENTIKTDLVKNESGFTCFGTLEIKS